MKNLFKFEFRKLFHRTSFYVCTSIMILVDILSIVAVHLLGVTSYSDMSAWEATQTAISGNLLTIVLAVFVSMFVCEDTTGGTIKNICGKGYDRLQVFITKYLVSLCGTLIIYYACMAFMFIYALISGASLEFAGSQLGLAYAAQLVVIIATHTLIFSVAVLIGKNGLAIAINVLIPMFITLPLLIIDYLVDMEKMYATNCWLDQLKATTISYISEPLSDALGLSTVVGGNGLEQAVILSIVYFAVFAVLGVFINQKKQY